MVVILRVKNNFVCRGFQEKILESLNEFKSVLEELLGSMYNFKWYFVDSYRFVGSFEIWGYMWYL